MNCHYIQSISQDRALCIFPQKLSTKVRSSRPNVFSKKVILKNLAKFAGKHLCQSLFFDKVAGLRSATLLKKRL